MLYYTQMTIVIFNDTNGRDEAKYLHEMKFYIEIPCNCSSLLNIPFL